MLALLDRPLVVGLAWALVSGDFKTALGICVFFELIWLDLFPAGTYIPPHRPAAAVTALALATAFGLHQPSMAVPAILAGLGAGLLGNRLEQELRSWQNHQYNQLVRASREDAGDFSPELTVRRGVLVNVLVSTAAFLGILTAFFVLFPLVLPMWSSTASASEITWLNLWLGGSVGGLLSLRWKRAYGLVVAGVLVVAMSGLIGMSQF